MLCLQNMRRRIRNGTIHPLTLSQSWEHFCPKGDLISSRDLWPVPQFWVDYYLFWDLFHTIHITLGPIPQFQYFIVDQLHNHWQPVAQFDFFLNYLSNLEQANSFSNVWILSCIFKTLLCANDMPHLVQVNGFFPLLVISCVFNWQLRKYALPHLQQENDFLPPWILACRLDSFHDFV